MSSPLSFLESIAGFTGSRSTTSADRPALLGVVDPAYAATTPVTLPKVTFDGESTLSAKRYPYVDSYCPAAGDRVVLIPVGTTYLIVGAIATSGSGIPAGAIQQFAASSAPAGWLVCNGAAVSRSTYARLFSAIGTAWGVGNGSTTFNVPDLRGRVPVGVDAAQTDFNALGKTGGATTHTLSGTEMPTHTHTQNAHGHTQNAHGHTQNAHGHTQDAHTHTQNAHGHTSSTGADFWLTSATGALANGTFYGANSAGAIANTTATNQNTTATNQNTTATNQNTTATNQNTGGGGAHNNLQPYVALTYIIKV